MADLKKAPAKTTKAKKVVKDVEVKTVEQLNEELVKLHADHLESRKSHRQGELVNPHILTVQRKSIARILTALNAAKKEAK